MISSAQNKNKGWASNILIILIHPHPPLHPESLSTPSIHPSIHPWWNPPAVVPSTPRPSKVWPVSSSREKNPGKHPIFRSSEAIGTIPVVQNNLMFPNEPVTCSVFRGTTKSATLEFWSMFQGFICRQIYHIFFQHWEDDSNTKDSQQRNMIDWLMLIEGKILDVKDHFLCKGFVHIPPQKNLQKKTAQNGPNSFTRWIGLESLSNLEKLHTFTIDITCFTVSSAK